MNQMIFDMSIYQLLSYFMVYSVAGWMMETVRVSYMEKRFVNRGFFHGIYCPIYGFGMCGIIIVLSPLRSHLVLIFIVGIIFATGLEYITSWVMETIFHARWWDYRDRKYNLNGRVCLSISLAWGFLSIIMIRWVHPIVEKLVNEISFQIGSTILMIFYSVLMIDCIFSLIAAFHLSSKIKALEVIKQELLSMINNSPIHERMDELIDKYNQIVNSIHQHNVRVLKAFPNIIKSKAIHRLNSIKDVLNGRFK
ncbi:putative ABC transporter permease [Bacillus massilinigeriensis]|uniref:putative ABC transporter permease n=1 Tax=Bacillus massilionigeriensis TaxID=1805475 RepID=UPI00096B22AF|nr:putative ABC transporter permease [Bacillus massilionigeriensis]